MRRAFGLLLGIACALAPRVADAKRGVRPLFEPTDLELEDPGVTELDLQAGFIRGQGPWRLVVPDFEFDLGIFRNLEFDVDGAYALEDSDPSSKVSFDSPAPDNLWPALKIGIYDWADDDKPGADVWAWAVGTQVGPKLPVAPGSRGVGFEGLVLVGNVVHEAHFVLNAGAFVDPHPSPDAARSIGIELGLDFDRDLDSAGHYQVTAELSGVKFVSSDPNQLLATAGLAWSPNEATQISLVGLVGFLEGSDRYGALLGWSQKLRLFGRHH
ncbi:MAG TPA: hypothetical protein VHJ20_22545 [Polyangia bacterium]|nr:hypothetical protein [Polyangia bacterium]